METAKRDVVLHQQQTTTYVVYEQARIWCSVVAVVDIWLLFRQNDYRCFCGSVPDSQGPG